jgi:hypothetical protein
VPATADTAGTADAEDAEDAVELTIDAARFFTRRAAARIWRCSLREGGCPTSTPVTLRAISLTILGS